METFTPKIRTKNGFTLIEIAIVLILIGILIGIVIRGTGSTKTAKVNATIESFRVNLTSTENYFNTYRRYPGDNNGDGKIEHNAIPILETSGFEVKKKHPFNDVFYIMWVNFPGVDSGNCILTENIPLWADSIIESQVDDGNFNTGKYRRISGFSLLKF